MVKRSVKNGSAWSRSARGWSPAWRAACRHSSRRRRLDRRRLQARPPAVHPVPRLPRAEGRTSATRWVRTCAGVHQPQGRVAEGFAYSPALKGAALTWDRATLDRWIEKPSAVVPGNSMAFAGVANPKDRAALIAYIEASRRRSRSPRPQRHDRGDRQQRRGRHGEQRQPARALHLAWRLSQRSSSRWLRKCALNAASNRSPRAARRRRIASSATLRDHPQLHATPARPSACASSTP